MNQVIPRDDRLATRLSAFFRVAGYWHHSACTSMQYTRAPHTKPSRSSSVNLLRCRTQKPSYWVAIGINSTSKGLRVGQCIDASTNGAANSASSTAEVVEGKQEERISQVLVKGLYMNRVIPRDARLATRLSAMFRVAGYWHHFRFSCSLPQQPTPPATTPISQLTTTTHTSLDACLGGGGVQNPSNPNVCLKGAQATQYTQNKQTNTKNLWIKHDANNMKWNKNFPVKSTCEAETETFTPNHCY